MDEVVEVVGEVSAADVAKSQIFLTGVAVGAGLGLAVGGIWWVVASKQLKTKYEKLAEAEIAEAKAFYSRLHKTGEFSSPQTTVEKLADGLENAAEALTRYQGRQSEDLEVDDLVEPTVTTTVERTNVFEETRSDYIFDLVEELKRRSPDKPYVINEDEWAEGQDEWQQVTLTYYAGDATLADEKEEHIPDVEAVIGSANLDRFGHGCEDANTVFIRNEKMGVQFEVVRSQGKYAHEVLGLQHSDETYARRPRRTRLDDD